jgi:hypothetical protein
MNSSNYLAGPETVASCFVAECRRNGPLKSCKELMSRCDDAWHVERQSERPQDKEKQEGHPQSMVLGEGNGCFHGQQISAKGDQHRVTHFPSACRPDKDPIELKTPH